MRGQILWEGLDIPTDKGTMSPSYTVWYQDEQGQRVASEEGSDLEQTIEALRQNLERRGYKRSALRKPDPFRRPPTR
jgi:hypothetical protein